jgi:hypothetical protein
MLYYILWEADANVVKKPAASIISVEEYAKRQKYGAGAGKGEQGQSLCIHL